MVNNPVCGNPPRMQYYYKLEDILLRLDEDLKSPFLENKMKPHQRSALLKKVMRDLKFGEVIGYAKKNRYPINQIYINLIPIFTSSVVKVFKALKSNGFEFVGYDAQVYEAPFTNELTVDYSIIDYKPLRILV